MPPSVGTNLPGYSPDGASLRRSWQRPPLPRPARVKPQVHRGVQPHHRPRSRGDVEGIEEHLTGTNLRGLAPLTRRTSLRAAPPTPAQIAVTLSESKPEK